LKQAEGKLNAYRSSNGRIDARFQTEYLYTQMSDINRQIDNLKLKKVNLLQKFTENHPFVIATNLELNELTRRRADLLNQLKKIPESEQSALNLKREVEVKNNLYMLLLNQIHQLEVIKSGIISDVQIISYATTPYKLQSTRLPIIGIFALVIGAILGCIGVLGWKMFFKNRKNLMQVLR
jgi:tyrosine-protein kinase Etk/Wzc